MCTVCALHTIDLNVSQSFWHFCDVGELISFVIERSLPAIGLVTATWHISAVNSRPPLQRFEHTAGSVLFDQVHHNDDNW